MRSNRSERTNWGLRGGAADEAAVFASREGGPLTKRTVSYMLKRAAGRAGLPSAD
jgi:hypothetical protein